MGRTWKKYPNKIALMYNQNENDDLFPGGILYAIGDDDDTYLELTSTFNKDFGRGIRREIYHTTPVDLLGNFMYSTF